MSTALLAMHAATIHALPATHAVLGATFPDSPAAAPPGSAGLVTLIGWVKWVCLGLCIAALCTAGGSYAWAHHHSGNGAEIVEKVGRVALGVFVIAGAVSLITALSGGGGAAGAAPAPRTPHSTHVDA